MLRYTASSCARWGHTKNYQCHLFPQISELGRKKEEVIAERLKIATRLKERRSEGERLGEQLEQVERTLAEAKEREVSLLENRASLELQLRHRTAEHHTLFELLTGHAKERDREAK